MAGFFKNIVNKLQRKPEVDWDELEADLVRADLGIRLSMDIMDELKDMSRKVMGDDVVETTKRHISNILPDESFSLEKRKDGSPTVILMVGVNGSGKTTSSAKLAKLLRDRGDKVLLAAADTFRAAAVEQLQAWAARLNLDLYTGRPNQDPSSVCYEAQQKATREAYDFLICDTAGRLHTRNNLMEELSKLKRTVSKQDETAPHCTLLVVDATTGGNAMMQAKEFSKAIDLDGLVVTKLDGSGKGGVAVAIYNELKISPRFIGTGEEPEQFELFDKDRFVNQVL